MKEFKILAMGDIHLGEIDDQNFIENEIPYIKNMVEKYKPDMLLLNGDTTDEDRLLLSSQTGKTLSTFCNELKIIGESYNVLIRILKGTNSHDGNNIKNISELLLSDRIKHNRPLIRYIEEIEKEFFLLEDGSTFTVGFIPEPYYPEYDQFIEDLRNYIGVSDVVCFHGMLDKAIVQLKQINSQYQLKRTMVVQNKDLSKFYKYCAICSHVHSELKFDNSYYIHRFSIPKKHILSDASGVLGLKLFTFKNNIYEYKRIPNPYAKVLPFFDVLVDDRDISEIQNEIKSKLIRYSIDYRCKMNEVIIRFKVDSDINSHYKLRNLISIYNNTNTIKVEHLKKEKTSGNGKNTINGIKNISKENLPYIIKETIMKKMDKDISLDNIMEYIKKEE